RTTWRLPPAVSVPPPGLPAGASAPLPAGLAPASPAERRARLDRPGRRRAVGGGDVFDLGVADQLLLTVVWLRHDPTQECLGFLFGASDSSALRAVRRCLPLLARAGPGALPVPDPAR